MLALAVAVALCAQSAEPEWVILPERRHGHRAHLIGDQILVLGGYLRGGAYQEGMRDALLYDVRSRRWTQQPPLHHDKAFFASAMIERSVYAVGESIEKFTLGSARWEVVCQDASLPKSHFGAAAVSKRIYLVGKEIQVFDIDSRKLFKVAPYPGMKPGDHFEIVASLRGGLHVIGGLDWDTFQARKAHYVYESGKWAKLPDAPDGLFTKFAAVEVVGDILYFLSAEGSFRYDGRTKAWKKLAPMPKSFAMPASVHRQGWIHILGGQPVDGQPGYLMYEVAADRWHRRPSQ